jgi:hypothetical protein
MPVVCSEEPSMKPLRLKFAALLAALGLLTFVSPASADGRWHGGGGRWHGGVSLQLGIPFPYYWGPSYYYGPPAYYYAPPPAYYYGPPVAAQPAAPPVYVERDAPAPPAAAPQATWWYWCASERGYYPYVKECPGGWQRVPPQQ